VSLELPFSTSEVIPYEWLISAEKIFKSKIIGFVEFTTIIDLEFDVVQQQVKCTEKSTDPSIVLKRVKIFMTPGSHCAMLQGRMAKGIIIEKITLIKTATVNEKREIIESLEYSHCVIDTFAIYGNEAAFSFQYISCSYSYTEFKADGVRVGNATGKIGLSSR
jgi:hypothetical protein